MNPHEVKSEIARRMPQCEVTLHDNNRKILITVINPNGNPAFRPMGFSVEIMKNKAQRDMVIKDLTLQVKNGLGDYPPPIT